MTARSWLLLFLLLDIIGMALIAAFYLRKRQLSLLEVVLWSVIALIPVLGPFLLIASRPGQPIQPRSDSFD